MLVKSPGKGDCLPVHVELEVVFMQMRSGLTRPEASSEVELQLAVRTNPCVFLEVKQRLEGKTHLSRQAFSIRVRPDTPVVVVW